MDKATRNAIERATQQARRLLDDDFSTQLEGTFDVLRGGIIASKAGPHLSALQQSQRDKIVAAIEHKRSAGMTASEAVTDYVRDAAFTTLNRFVALKMLEARQLVQECITRGEQSAGYREFCGMAPGVALLPDAAGYRLYIESLFDEFSTEIKVLFDRRDAASVLWPRRQTFEALLTILNSQDLSGVWGEDETIGWVYQFFNSGEERRQMRDESQAPRNSRELAARNQFFTPRYVVQFLTENTLGRIWYEMRQGKTRLVSNCEYLVRRPKELFLANGEKPPIHGEGEDEILTQAELLNKPIHTPFRSRRDPRDLKILDPACGSGHFLLYAFDLLVTIYEEAWEDEESPASESTQRRLRDEYPSMDVLHRAIPGLILRHNLHGIDIDPRAAQIAALALWLRAQSLYIHWGVGSLDRPQITKTNIVVAERMPGESKLRKEFTDLLDAQLQKLVDRVFQTMELAGEAGSLLDCKEEIRLAIRDIYGEAGSLFQKVDEDVWTAAERRLLEQLERYASNSQDLDAHRRRLFIEDTARGFGFIEVSMQRFDVLLTNPPFGSAAPGSLDYLKRAYPLSLEELAASFITRCRQWVCPNGLIGAITSRTIHFLEKLAGWRDKTYVDHGGLVALLDLGYGVLDGAMVETAAAVFRTGDTGVSEEAVFVSRLDTKDKATPPRMDGTDQIFAGKPGKLVVGNNKSLAYWVPQSILRVLRESSTLKEAGGAALKGMSTDDDPRFLRLWWESPENDATTWKTYAKGGAWSPFYSDLPLRVKWGNDGFEIKAAIERHYGVASRHIINESFYLQPGLTYSDRTTSGFGPRVLPAGSIFSTAGPGIAPPRDIDPIACLGILTSRLAHVCVEMFVGGGDSVHSGSAARHYTVGVVNGIPFLDRTAEEWPEIARHSLAIFEHKRKEAIGNPRSLLFEGFELSTQPDLATFAATRQRQFYARGGLILSAWSGLDAAVNRSFRLQEPALAFLDGEAGPIAADYANTDSDEILKKEVLTIAYLTEKELVSIGLERVGGKRYISKCVQVGDRRTELISHILKINGATVAEYLGRAPVPEVALEESCAELIEYGLGIAFNRWKTHRLTENELYRNPCDPLPRDPPALERHADNQSLVLEDDSGRKTDIVAVCLKGLAATWDRPENEIRDDFESWLGKKDYTLRQWIACEAFSRHVASHSGSRRQAPIFWQLSTPSASYSVWMYYHRLTKDTFYRVLNDYIAPKCRHEEQKLANMIHDAGEHPGARQRREIADQETFVQDLRVFLQEVASVAPLWRPELNDGVIVNFAPLWRLVPQCKSWQQELKTIWDSLCQGELDWTHLAMHLWPERVIPKCTTDRSLAIAHGLEEVFWLEGDDGKWKPRSAPPRSVTEFVRERTSAAVKAALKNLLEAPVASAAAGRGRSRRATTSAADGGAR